MSDVSDMPLTDFIDVIESIAQAQDSEQVDITLIGGEPLLRPDIVECGRQMQVRGFRWGLCTNGILLTDPLYHKLVDVGMTRLIVSLDGLEHEHNWLHAGHEAFAAAISAISMACADERVDCTVLTHVNGRNFDYLPEMADLLRPMGIDHWILTPVCPNGIVPTDKELQLESYQMRGLMQFILRQRTAGFAQATYSCESFLGKYEGRVRDHYFSCHAGISMAAITVNGDIIGCPTIHHGMVEGNVYEGDSFMDVWNTCFSAYRKRTWLHTEACTHCKVFRYCNGGCLHLRTGADATLLRCDYYRL